MYYQWDKISLVKSSKRLLIVGKTQVYISEKYKTSVECPSPL